MLARRFLRSMNEAVLRCPFRSFLHQLSRVGRVPMMLFSLLNDSKIFQKLPSPLQKSQFYFIISIQFGQRTASNLHCTWIFSHVMWRNPLLASPQIETWNVSNRFREAPESWTPDGTSHNAAFPATKVPSPPFFANPLGHPVRNVRLDNMTIHRTVTGQNAEGCFWWYQWFFWVRSPKDRISPIAPKPQDDEDNAQTQI